MNSAFEMLRMQAFTSLLGGDPTCYQILDLDPNWLSQLEDYVGKLLVSKPNLRQKIDNLAQTNEIVARHKALNHFKEAWEVMLGNRDPRENLDNAASEFNSAWGLGQSPHELKFSVGVETTDDRDRFIVQWLQSIQPFTRGHQVVLDLLLQKIFCADRKSYDVNPMRAWLYKTFRQRIDSLVSYREWVTANENQLKSQSIDYCKTLTRSVCTPILLSAGSSGEVMWLTIDLFEDGLGFLAPDIFSLGLSRINGGTTASNDGSPTDAPSEEQDNVSILHSFDNMWEMSRLGKLGFSGRWRITYRPTTQCAALFLEKDSMSSQYLTSYTGRSAECAMLVSLLAASGFVYEPPPEKKPSGLKPRVFLNTFFAATATVLSTKEEDLRSSPLGRVYDVDCKLGASTRYKYEPGKEESPPLIDTIVISAGDYEARKGDTKSPVYKAIEREKQEKQATKGNQPAVRGVHFQACSTVQKALDWMLATNNWSRLRKEAQKKTWESQWGIVRNESGQPISWDVDENGVHKTVSEEDGICTGSLEYMRNPFGGARRVTPENEPQSESVDNDEVLNVE